MRQLMPAAARRAACARQRGMTLVEIAVTLAIGALLMSMAAPSLADFWVNHQLREAGNGLLAETLYARAEAIKRNTPIRLAVSGNDLSVRDMADGADGVLLRQRRLADDIRTSGSAQMDFDSRGLLLPLGTEASIDVAKTGVTCSSDLRCPGLRVDGGGSVRLCADKLACT